MSWPKFLVKSPGTVTIVKSGQPTANIYVGPVDPDGKIMEAARTLSHYVEKATGVGLKVWRHPWQWQVGLTGRGNAVIYVGLAALKRHGILPSPVPFPSNLDDDGFVFQVDPGRNRVVICGPTDWGTEFGVYDFLERELGVRWLMPGEAVVDDQNDYVGMGNQGEDVPSSESMVVAEGTRIEAPAFRSRRVSGLYAGGSEERWKLINDRWARFNRMHDRLGSRPEGFHHNLWSLLLSRKDGNDYYYEKNHPDFFPKWNGTPHLPSSQGRIDVGWQPCFSAPGLVDEVVSLIVKYFDDHPYAVCFSLGVNDGGGFCECAGCKPAGQKENYLGLPDYSDVYYNWTDQVIKGVLAEWADRIAAGKDLGFDPEKKWFGCLAYREVAEPPQTAEIHTKPQTAEIHTKLIPFIVEDRMEWLEPEAEKDRKILTARWNAETTRLGWYDWAYGDYYCVPRMYGRLMQDYLSWGSHQGGVTDHYSELCPSWGEGPKPFVYLRLQWDPSANPGKLLAEWCERAVGPKAAPYLERYYQKWECFWTSEHPGGNHRHPVYLGKVPGELVRRSRELMDKVMEECQVGDPKWRWCVFR